ncbi:hypothetical protein LWI28_026145 [Acer negundo]|uniref:F-box domain-containing protein n=1 Tax=Acer negundo TaxID=4023 RepID=A0AAD5IG87_ACENE|nr:hypothetical protein LWI28_026145 [Acer negundo]
MENLSSNILYLSDAISANLPGDMVSDIFTRLPVKSLCRFKCVSKSMYSMLHSPNFVKKHTNRAIQKDPSMILRTEFRLYAAEEDEEHSKVRKLQVPFARSLEKIGISGSCNGLLCISDQRHDEDIYIYNPSTRVYRKLPVPEFDIPTNIDSTFFTSLGFGFHQNDYKLVRSLYLYDKPLEDIDSYKCEARIYSFSTNKWRKIGVIPFHIRSRVAIMVHNNFVWTASRGLGTGMSILVVAFDLDREEFWEVPRPEITITRQCQIEVNVFEGRFSIYYMWKNDRVEIWTMEEFRVKQSWKKQFVIGPNLSLDNGFLYLKPLLVMRKGKILIEQGEGELILYDPKSETATNFKIRAAPRWFRVTSFVGSLVSPFHNQ